MSVKRILVNTIWVGIVPRLSTLLTIVLLPFSTPFLTAGDYGIVGIVTSYQAIFYALFTLGLTVHLNNSFFEYGNKFTLVWKRVYFLFIISGIVCSMLISLILFQVLDGISIIRTIVIVALISSQFIFGSHTILANHLFPLRNKFKEMVIPILIANIIGIVCSFIMITWFKLGYLGLLANAGISTFISFVLFIKPLWLRERILPVVDLKIRRLKELFKISLPVVPHTLGFMLMASSDRLVMQFYDVPIQSIGLYTNGYNIGDYVNVLTTAIIITLSPVIQKLYLEKRYTDVRQLYYFSQIVTFFIIFICSIWMKEIYLVLIRNTELQGSSYIASIICFSSVLYPFYYLLSVITFADKKTTKILWLVLVPGLLNLVLNFIFIPFYGYNAALYTTLVSYWSILFIPIFISYYRNIYGLFFKTSKTLLATFTSISLLLILSQVLLEASIGAKITLTVLIVIVGIRFLFISNKHISFDIFGKRL